MPDVMPETEVEIETSTEMPVSETPVETMPEAPVEPVAPAQPSEVDVLRAENDSLRAEVAGLVSARDVAMGQASEAMAMVQPMQAELAVLRERCANYELGSALAGEGLPSTAGPLVMHLYSTMNSKSARPMGLSDWLKTYLGTPEGAVLALLKGAPAQDPRSAASSTSTTGASSLARLQLGPSR